MRKKLQPRWVFRWEELEKNTDFPLTITMVRDGKAVAPLHSHEFFELLFVVAGTGIYETSSGRYQLKQGDIFLLHPGDVHGFSNQHHLVVYNILWKTEELCFDFREIENLPGYHLFFHLEPNSRESNHFKRHLNLDKGQLAFVQALVERLHDEIRSRRSGYKLLARSLLAELFVMICRFCIKLNEEKDNELLQMARIINFMQANYNKALNRASLARMANMSEATFFRHFKQATGFSPMDYLLNLRLAKAEELLRTTSLSLTDISAKCGFYDSNYFGMQFRKRYEITPHRFRRLFR